MKLNMLICCLVFIILIFISCDTESEPTYGDTIIRGQVVDKQDSTPIDCVLVTLSSAKFMGYPTWENLNPLTDSSGCFYYEYFCMEDYSYDVSFSKDGYLFNSYPVQLNEGRDNYMLIEMEKDTTNAK